MIGAGFDYVKLIELLVNQTEESTKAIGSGKQLDWTVCLYLDASHSGSCKEQAMRWYQK